MSTSITPPEQRQHEPRYVLLTAAHNEDKFIEGTIQSVLRQTLLPRRWVIVSDNSTDRTDEIIQRYARDHDFMRVLHISRAPGRSFGAKVTALQQGSKLLKDVEYDFLGNLDADLSIEASYFEELINYFLRSTKLGIASGFIYENTAGKYRGLRTNNTRDVFHAAQLVRRECYDAISGYAVLKYGGEDWYAQTKAKILGWHVESFPNLKVFHHRHITGDSSVLGNAFRLGRLDYSFGSDPFFEMCKCFRRIPERPYFANAMVRLAGFAWCHLCGEPRCVSDDIVSFLRQEQKARVCQLLSRWQSALQPRSSS